MKETDVLGAKGRRCTVLLQADGDGMKPTTRLKALVRDRTGVKVTRRVFDSLEDAMAYAQILYREA